MNTPRSHVLSNLKKESDFPLNIYILGVAFASAAIPFGSIYIKFDWLFGLLLLFFRAKMVMLEGRLLNEKMTVYVIIYTSYLVIAGIYHHSLNEAFELTPYLKYLLQYIFAFFIFLTIVSSRISSKILTKAIHFWLFLACSASILAIMQKLMQAILVDRILFIPYYANNIISEKVISGIMATPSWFAEASHFGSFVVIPIIYVLWTFFRKTNEKFRIPYTHFILLIFLLVGLILSYSLGTILSLLVGLSVMLYYSNIKKAGSFSFIICIFLILAYTSNWSETLNLQIERVHELILNLFDFEPGNTYYGTKTSFYIRSKSLSYGLSLFLSNPFMGVGLAQPEISIDSGVVSLMAEQGVIGTALYFFAPFFALKSLLRIRNFTSRNSPERNMATFFIIGIMVDYANGFITHNAFHLQRWLLVSLALSWVMSIKKSRVSSRRWRTNAIVWCAK